MKVAFCTLGCKVNFYETEKMMASFQKHGFEIVMSDERADIFVINTCTVTNMADRKSRQMIHRGKKNNPNCLVVAVGCYAQSDGDKLREDESIDLVLDNTQKENVVEHVMKHLEMTEENEVCQSGYDYVHERTRAFIKVQSGCNQFCSYCIIPYVRGSMTSRPVDEVVTEVRSLVKQGFQEVVVTGIHLSSYGVDCKDARAFVGAEGKPLLELLSMIGEVDGIQRIRLGSLEPRIITEGFLRELANHEKVCPHFHLSLQSGCDATLARMNRHYTISEYADKCELIRGVYQNPAITTDVIVGFPGETEEEFECTKKNLEKMRLAEMHIFKYSRRDGTKAASMPEQVPEEIKTKRSNELLKLDDSLREQYTGLFMGHEEAVLFEEIITRDGEDYLVGHTERYVKVAVPKSDAIRLGYKENEIFQVRVEHILKK